MRCLYAHVQRDYLLSIRAAIAHRSMIHMSPKVRVNSPLEVVSARTLSIHESRDFRAVEKCWVTMHQVLNDRAAGMSGTTTLGWIARERLTPYGHVKSRHAIG